MTGKPRLLHEVLSLASARAPGDPAVELEGASWDYARLHEAASRVAARLVEAGVRPGDRVAVCLRKSPETVASLFGILQAGAVFVPIDRSAPVARMASIAADCAPAALIGSGRKSAGLAAAPEFTEPLRLVIDVPQERRTSLREAPGGTLMHWDEALSGAPLPAPVRRAPGDLAYILYTSGSTGIPKGVMITHENALAFTSWARRRFGVEPRDRVASVAPFHFDLSTFDLYSALEGGATVVLVPEEIALFPNALAGHLESAGVTIAYLTPSTITGMLLRGDLEGRRMESLRTILFAGEIFQPRMLARLMRSHPRIELYNLYGPTETNVCSYYQVQPGDAGRPSLVPIGVAASGAVLFAIDDEGMPVKGPGKKGELLAAGPTIAAGYWGDPEKTADLFLEGHPQGPRGAKVYRTGDRVSLDEEGNWLFHGRRDHMVKSRGYRIEIGDIESALYGLAEVDEAAAIAVPDDEIGNRIKACVVLRPECSLDPAQVVQHCARVLPRYMVPEKVELMPSLPKTSSGKIDRRRLASTGQGVGR